MPKLNDFYSLIISIFIATAFGFLAGAFMSDIAPEDEISWIGIAFIPVWFLIEMVFSILVESLGVHSKKNRRASIACVLIGFYWAWYVFRVNAL